MNKPIFALRRILVGEFHTDDGATRALDAVVKHSASAALLRESAVAGNSDHQKTIHQVRKPLVDPASLVHRQFASGEFWRNLSVYQDVDESVFLDHLWQAKNTVTRVEGLMDVIREFVSDEFAADAALGFKRAPMSVRVSPYILSLIDWSQPYRDSIRRQFIPLASELLPDHPMLGFDSLNEQADSPVPGLTHRYPDKALFLALDTCPIYCRFCTRSYAVGVDTESNFKVNLRVNSARWKGAFEYIASRPELEDIVVSGGDTYQLKPSHIQHIGETLLAMPNIRRIRFATKGLIAMPQKIITDHAWREALFNVVRLGRKLHKEVVIHTHFNHPNEITSITQQAMNLLVEEGVVVRNQSVLQRAVNDDINTMRTLVKRLSYINIMPYYVYVHDLVKGVEDLRTSVAVGAELDKQVRGYTAGYNTPIFIVDAPGDGGKRLAESYEHYDRETGISVYKAPAVSQEALYLYFDPLNSLSPDVAERWHNPQQRQEMIAAAIAKTRGVVA